MHEVGTYLFFTRIFYKVNCYNHSTRDVNNFFQYNIVGKTDIVPSVGRYEHDKNNKQVR